MKIVKVGHHCCIRLVKQALALIEKGHEVHLIGFNKPSARQVFKTFVLCKTVDQLRNAIKLYSDVDIFHIHNEPNWMLPIVKECIDKPVVLDVHDSMEYRGDMIYKSAMERLAFEMADGFVFVSNSCRDISIKANQSITKKPNCILHSYVNRDFYKTKDWAWVGGLVYEGLISTDKSSPYMQYANYKQLLGELNKKGIPFHIYTAQQDDYFKEYYKGIASGKTLDYGTLLSQLGHHDWGLCGNVTKYRNWDVAMPNKLFEYMAGGIPIVAMNCKEISNFVTEHKIGIVVNSVDELANRWKERAECQKNVFKKRGLFTIDKKINVLEKLYKKVLG